MVISIAFAGCGRLRYEKGALSSTGNEDPEPTLPGQTDGEGNVIPTLSRVSDDELTQDNLIDITLDATTGPTWTINTDIDTGSLSILDSLGNPYPESGGIIDAQVIPQTDSQGINFPDLPQIARFIAKNIVVEENVTVNVSGPNALMLVAQESITINGTINVSAGTQSFNKNTEPGPGGFRGGSSVFNAESTKLAEGFGSGDIACNCHQCTTGGGGSGHSSSGGQGDDQGSGGALYGSKAIELLIGGSGGGPGAAGDSGGCTFSRGGGGGGAVQLSTLGTLTVSASGVISANGAGASSRRFSDSRGLIGGAGGGAGGRIVLEAKSVVVDGQLVANGGGGGIALVEGEDDSNQAGGINGQHGLVSASPAAGGESSAAGNTSRGGAGGAGDQAPTTGENLGGGGGSAGRILFRAVDNPSISGLISPTGEGFFTQMYE